MRFMDDLILVHFTYALNLLIRMVEPWISRKTDTLKKYKLHMNLPLKETHDIHSNSITKYQK